MDEGICPCQLLVKRIRLSLVETGDASLGSILLPNRAEILASAVRHLNKRDRIGNWLEAVKK